jgi:hypothetical protein
MKRNAIDLVKTPSSAHIRVMHGLLTSLFFGFGFPSACSGAVPSLRVSDNHRFLVKEDDTPFFYLGDTAWELFQRLNREEADRYLENRAQKGFTVIQAVALAELDGHAVSNAYGHQPLVNLDPARPAVRDDGDYWTHVDYIVNKAESVGLFIGFLPTWGRYWHDNVNGGKPLFTEENAATLGEWLGRRYKDRPEWPLDKA